MNAHVQDKAESDVTDPLTRQFDLMMKLAEISSVFANLFRVENPVPA
jgi:hypothetical protein